MARHSMDEFRAGKPDGVKVDLLLAGELGAIDRALLEVLEEKASELLGIVARNPAEVQQAAARFDQRYAALRRLADHMRASAAEAAAGGGLGE
jgi:hypothetical protein